MRRNIKGKIPVETFRDPAATSQVPTASKRFSRRQMRESKRTSRLKSAFGLLVGVLLAASCLIFTGKGVAAAEDRHQALDTTAVDALVKKEMEAHALPGVSVAITRGKDVLYVRGYGLDSTGAHITEETPFRVASVSKSFTSLAVMQLVEEEKIGLDEPVKKYLPAFRTSDPRSDEITVRELLNQTSGMADRGFPEVSLPQPSSLRGAVEQLHSANLVAKPGTQWNYHNPNYQVAARLVEAVSEEPFDEYLKHHVFGPLGMDRSTTTAKDDQHAPGLTEGHSFAYGRPYALPGPGYFVEGSGGVITTASDMARWLVMQNNGGVAANGKRVVSAKSIEEMHTPSEPGGYALGWDTDGPKKDPTRIEHGGCCFAWSAEEVLLPDGDYGVAVLFNSASPLGMDEANVAAGVSSIVAENAPRPQGPASSIVDAVLGILTLAAFGLGILGVIRSGRWTVRRQERPAWRIALWLFPHLVLLVSCLAFPILAGFLFGGRDVTWFSTAYNWLALVALVAVTALAELCVIVARIGHLARARRRTSSTKPSDSSR